jgi:Fic family protein
MDNYQALRYILEQADKKQLLTPEFLQQCNSLNMANLTDTFCAEINRQILNNSSIIEHLTTSFDAHANLVLIHPWMDGNKRTSRLMMNFIQRRAELPLTKVHKEDSREYLFALKEVKDNKNLEVFRNFMYNQYIKTLNNEISDYVKSKKRGFHLVF